MKNKSIIISIAALGCVACMTAYGQNPRPFGKTHVAGNPNGEVSSSPAKSMGKQLSSQDKNFIMNAAKGGMMEVDMGKMAAQNAKNADVKKFGNHMVADHTKANGELMALAKADGVSMPSAKSPGKWKSDKDYMNDQVAGHEKMLSEMQTEAKNGSDADLKKFADKTSKTVMKHLQMAKDLQAKM